MGQSVSVSRSTAVARDLMDHRVNVVPGSTAIVQTRTGPTVAATNPSNSAVCSVSDWHCDVSSNPNRDSDTDDVCSGEHGTQGSCCDQRLYCHKNDASWAQGRCYRRRGIIYRPQAATRKPTTTTSTTTTTRRPATESQPMTSSIIPGLNPSTASSPSSGGDDFVIEPGLHLDPNLPDNPDMGFDRK